MNAELRRIRDRALRARQEAVTQAIATLRPNVQYAFSVVDWSRSIEEAYIRQWGEAERHPDGGWDWPEMRRRYKSPRDQFIVVRSGERLCSLGLITATRARVKVEFLEGDPREDCPMRGVRAALVLEIAALYGQRLGCREIHLDPVNEAVETLYIEGYGFERIVQRKGSSYLKRDLVET